MHSAIYVCVWNKACGCCDSHALEIRCDGNTIVAWERNQTHPSRDDKRCTSKSSFLQIHLQLISHQWQYKTIQHIFYIFQLSYIGIWNSSERRAYRYDEELVIPIIENTPFEYDLKDELNLAIFKYPETCAVLVRRHGIYVWGNSWQQAKTM